MMTFIIGESGLLSSPSIALQAYDLKFQDPIWASKARKSIIFPETECGTRAFRDVWATTTPNWGENVQEVFAPGHIVAY